MDFKKTNAPVTTVTRDVNSMLKDDMNVYEMVNVLGKRANQISIELKNELEKKLQEYKESLSRYSGFGCSREGKRIKGQNCCRFASNQKLD